MVSAAVRLEGGLDRADLEQMEGRVALGSSIEIVPAAAGLAARRPHHCPAAVDD
jgi:hypothetical protein